MLVMIDKYPDDGSSPDIEVHIDDFDTWSAKTTLAYVIVPLLEAFRDNRATKLGCWRACFDDDDDRSLEAWTKAQARQKEILDTMIYAFRAYIEEDDRSVDPEEDPRVQEGLRLFATHYSHLWN